eukprot:318632-Pleurochrysis_carterae.AAC.1
MPCYYCRDRNLLYAIICFALFLHLRSSLCWARDRIRGNPSRYSVLHSSFLHISRPVLVVQLNAAFVASGFGSFNASTVETAPTDDDAYAALFGPHETNATLFQ